MDIHSLAALLGNFGEFFGSIAVVGSLIFVGLEIRRTRNQSLVEGAENRLDAWNSWTVMILSNPEVRDIFFRGIRDMNSLNEDERLIFNQIMIFRQTILVRSFTRGRQLNDRQSLATTRGLLGDMFDEPGTVQWWRKYRNGWRLDFREFVDGALAEHEAANTQD